MSEETAQAPATEAAAPAAAPTTETAPATEAAPQSTPDIFSAQTQESSPSGDLMSQLYTSEGNLAENYTSLLEENGLGELTNTVAKYKSPEGLLKGAANLISFAGKKVEGVVVPNEGSTEQEIAEYRQAIGVPESPTAYDLQPENLPEGMGWDEGLAGEWQNAFHEAGISQEQAAKLSQAYSDITNNQLTQANQTLQLQSESEMEQQRAEIQKQWGDKYDTNLQNAVNMAATMGFDLESQQDMAAMRNPKVLNMILEKHTALQEGTMPRGGQPNTGTESFRDQANALYSKYPNMMTAPHDVRAKYQELRKLSSMQPQ
jgi:transposase